MWDEGDSDREDRVLYAGNMETEFWRGSGPEVAWYKGKRAEVVIVGV